MRVFHSPQAAVRLYLASAPLNDDEAIMCLSALLPSPAYLCAVVELPPIARGEEVARFVRCVGRELCVFWVPDVTPDQAAAITAECNAITNWSAEAFTAAVGRALGADVSRLQ
jgi:hypothetical protein